MNNNSMDFFKNNLERPYWDIYEAGWLISGINRFGLFINVVENNAIVHKLGVPLEIEDRVRENALRCVSKIFKKILEQTEMLSGFDSSIKIVRLLAGRFN